MSNPIAISSVGDARASITAQIYHSVTDDLIANLAVTQLDRDEWQRRAQAAEAKLACLEKATQVEKTETKETK